MASHFRIHPRFEIALRVAVRRHNERSARRVDATTNNLGFGGAFVQIEPPLPVGSRLRLSLSSATTWEPIELDATVCWVRDVGGALHAGMGVAFESLTPDQAFALHGLFRVHGFDE
ncbi:MAG: PilZ domain-containing protein [Deltaproteobacteria bacterium]|nr:PilZ domain-containing protein [Deltaproteobacteria bacterium]